MIRNIQLVKAPKQVEIDASDEAVYECGIGEAVPLSEQDGFENGQQGIGGTASEVTFFFDDSGISHSAADQSLDPTLTRGSGRCVSRSWLVQFIRRRYSWKIT